MPIGAASTCDEFASIADECVCAVAPDHFRAVGLVVRRLCPDRRRSRSATCWPGRRHRTAKTRLMRSVRRGPARRLHDTREWQRSSRARGDNVAGAGNLVITARGCRGRGLRSRQRQRPIQPAQSVRRAVLQEAGLATLLLDLLEENEANDRAKVFDIALLAGRLQSAANWLAGQPETARLAPGLFWGQHRGAAALLAAAEARAPSARSCRAEAGPTWPATSCPA